MKVQVNLINKKLLKSQIMLINGNFSDKIFQFFNDEQSYPRYFACVSFY